MLLREIAKLISASRRYPPYFTGTALARLMGCEWPENARSILATARALIIKCAKKRITCGQIEMLETRHLFLNVDKLLLSAISLKELRQRIERAAFMRALEKADLNITEAAKILGTSRGRVERFVRRLGLSREDCEKNRRARIQLLLQFGLA